jgi:hypothetical protein
MLLSSELDLGAEDRNCFNFGNHDMLLAAIYHERNTL